MRRYTITTRNFRITERHIRRNNFSATCAIEFAAPVSFGNLCPFKLGDRSRDLVHQLGKRIIGSPSLDKNRLLSEPFQLIQDEGLQYKLARQSVRAVGQQHLKTVALRRISHPVQGRTIQPATAGSFAGKFSTTSIPFLAAYARNASN